jgi:excinuclease ABC subunit A
MTIMRLLFARVGVPYSPATGLPIESQTVSQMVDRIKAMPEGTRLYLMAPDRARPQGRVPQGTAELQKQGLPARQGRRQAPRDRRGPGARQEVQARHRRRGRPHRRAADLGNRLADSLETALKLAEGLAIAENSPTSRCPWKRPVPAANKSRTRARLLRPLRLPRLGLHHRGDRAAPLLLQQRPSGACPTCDGLGVSRCSSTRDGRAGRPSSRCARAPSRRGPKSSSGLLHADARKLASTSRLQDCRCRGATCRRRCATRSCTARRRVESPCATTTASVPTRRPSLRGRDPQPRTPLEGDRLRLGARGVGTLPVGEPCEACNGFRLKPEALAVKIAGLHIGETAECRSASA